MVQEQVCAEVAEQVVAGTEFEGLSEMAWWSQLAVDAEESEPDFDFEVGMSDEHVEDGWICSEAVSQQRILLATRGRSSCIAGRR